MEGVSRHVIFEPFQPLKHTVALVARKVAVLEAVLGSLMLLVVLGLGEGKVADNTFGGFLVF